MTSTHQQPNRSSSAALAARYACQTCLAGVVIPLSLDRVDVKVYNDTMKDGVKTYGRQVLELFVEDHHIEIAVGRSVTTVLYPMLSRNYSVSLHRRVVLVGCGGEITLLITLSDGKVALDIGGVHIEPVYVIVIARTSAEAFGGNATGVWGASDSAVGA